jgi:hypothetical protein
MSTSLENNMTVHVNWLFEEEAQLDPESLPKLKSRKIPVGNDKPSKGQKDSDDGSFDKENSAE